MNAGRPNKKRRNSQAGNRAKKYKAKLFHHSKILPPWVATTNGAGAGTGARAGTRERPNKFPKRSHGVQGPSGSSTVAHHAGGQGGGAAAWDRSQFAEQEALEQELYRRMLMHGYRTSPSPPAYLPSAAREAPSSRSVYFKGVDPITEALGRQNPSKLLQDHHFFQDLDQQPQLQAQRSELHDLRTRISEQGPREIGGKRGRRVSKMKTIYGGFGAQDDDDALFHGDQYREAFESLDDRPEDQRLWREPDRFAPSSFAPGENDTHGRGAPRHDFSYKQPFFVGGVRQHADEFLRGIQYEHNEFGDSVVEIQRNSAVSPKAKSRSWGPNGNSHPQSHRGVQPNRGQPPPEKRMMKNHNKNPLKISSVSLASLSLEIPALCAFITPHPIETRARQLLVKRVDDVVHATFQHAARVRIYGSTQTGLSNFRSDLDICVHGWTNKAVSKTLVKSALAKLSGRLRKQPWCAEISVRARAKVPIINMRDSLTGIELDISLASFHDTQANYHKELFTFVNGAVPMFRPMVLLLKQLLNYRNLDKPFHGGVGSYKLYALVLQWLLQPAANTDQLGESVMGFFSYYGGSEDHGPVQDAARDWQNRTGQRPVISITKSHVGRLVQSAGFDVSDLDCPEAVTVDLNEIRLLHQCWHAFRDTVKRINHAIKHPPLVTTPENSKAKLEAIVAASAPAPVIDLTSLDESKSGGVEEAKKLVVSDDNELIDLTNEQEKQNSLEPTGSGECKLQEAVNIVVQGLDPTVRDKGSNRLLTGGKKKRRKQGSADLTALHMANLSKALSGVLRAHAPLLSVILDSDRLARDRVEALSKCRAGVPLEPEREGDGGAASDSDSAPAPVPDVDGFYSSESGS